MNTKTIGLGSDEHARRDGSAAATVLAPVRVNPVLSHAAERRLSLDGEWRFRLDPDDRGVNERWFDDGKQVADPIQVPGCWQGQGFGTDAKNDIMEGRFPMRTFRATYKGTGSYAKTFAAPAAWRGSRLWLNFGAVNPTAEVWLNGVRLGENLLPFVPFGFEIGPLVRWDEENSLVVRVHEQSRALALMYNMQGEWSGLCRSVELTATGPRFIEEFRVYPELDRQRLRLHVRVGGWTPGATPQVLRVAAEAIGAGSPEAAVDVPIASAFTECCIPILSPSPWSPDNPQLYRVDGVLADGATVLDALSERVGFVKLTTHGKHILVNDEPYYIRGHGDFPENPETGSPDTDRDRWRKRMQVLRAYGYNQIRCNSFVYPPEAFDAADETGVLIQSEMGTVRPYIGAHPTADNREVPNTSDQYRPLVVRDIPEPYYYRNMLRRQWNLVVARDVNHPSANIYCMSNELWIRRPEVVSDPTIADYQAMTWQCYGETKAVKPTALVIWTDGGDSAIEHALPADFLNDEAERDRPRAKPLIQHEWRWWSSYPDVRLIPRFTGAVRPYGAEIALEAARRRGVEHLLPLFADNSQRLQFIEAKAKMEERRRRFPFLAGISHFSACDFQLSPQGIVDDFYDRKYADAATWRQTNGDTVVLASLGFDDRVLESGGEFACELSVSDFSHPPLARPTLAWRLRLGTEVAAEGTLAFGHTPFQTVPAGTVRLTVPALRQPQTAHLEAELREGERVFANSWDLWIFPRAGLPASLFLYQAGVTAPDRWSGIPVIAPADLARTPGAIVLTEVLDEPLTAFLRGGGCVILKAGVAPRVFRTSVSVVRPHGVNGCGGAGYFFTPAAQFPPFDQGQNGSVIHRHPMLGDFPHEGFADWQFYRLISLSPPLDLEALGLEDEEPVVRVIHRYPTCHPVAHLLGHSVGRGGLILTSLDLRTDRPEARHLLRCLCAYAESGRLGQATPLPEQALARLTAAAALQVRMRPFALPARWRVFGPAAQAHCPFPPHVTAAVPSELVAGGRPLPCHDAETTNGHLDLAPLLGGTAAGKTAFVYIPFETERRGRRAARRTVPRVPASAPRWRSSSRSTGAA
ncbi:MAG: hypothetical protein FJ291_10765 [Planctomycetes bacterium]|nr:hypothetical protein [Planctomycetota bacterium]